MKWERTDEEKTVEFQKTERERFRNKLRGGGGNCGGRGDCIGSIKRGPEKGPGGGEGCSLPKGILS